MVTVAERGGPLGVIQPVVDAWQARGELLKVIYNDGRGDPAEVWLRGWPDRDAVDAEFDVGPLLEWVVDAQGHWCLVDKTTGTRTTTTLDAVGPVGGPWSAGTERTRVGYADLHPPLAASSWQAPEPDVELGRLAGEIHEGDGEQRFVSLADGVTAAHLRERVHEVLTAVLPALAAGTPPEEATRLLPGWFRDACAAPYVAGTSPLAGQLFTDAQSAHVGRWALSWTPERWLLAMSPAERTWAWVGSLAVSPSVIELWFERRARGAPIGSLKWLLHACGARECVAPPYPVDQRGRRIEPAAATPPASQQPRPGPASGPRASGWKRFVGQFRRPPG
ncbi:hypothetical protein [Nocardioides terrisoli]|uniref:hypothetical protein n=1 Tax=Nocardioides terrisoli TaxID=3388267 RepID=UPI00287BACC3|nr:hypothetical protein [Nocardioides marmorisolisilvae]